MTNRPYNSRKSSLMLMMLASLFLPLVPIQTAHAADDPTVPNLVMVCPDAPDPAFPWRCIGTPGISKTLNIVLEGPLTDFVGIQGAADWSTLLGGIQIVAVSIDRHFTDEPFDVVCFDDIADITDPSKPCPFDKNQKEANQIGALNFLLTTQTPFSLAAGERTVLLDLVFLVVSPDIGEIGTPNVELISALADWQRRDDLSEHGRRCTNEPFATCDASTDKKGPGSPGAFDLMSQQMRLRERGGAPKLIRLPFPDSIVPVETFYELSNGGIGTVPAPDASLLNFKVRVIDKRVDLSQGETGTQFTARITNLAPFQVFVRARYLVTGTVGTVILCNAPDLNGNCLIDPDDNFRLGPKGSATDTVDITITITPPLFPDNYKSQGILEASSVIIVGGTTIVPVGFITIERTTAATNFRVTV